MVDATRTPFARHAGALASIRCDDLAALPLQTLVQRHPQIDWSGLDDVVLGCANQAGEDNRNVARIAALLAGLPVSVPGMTGKSGLPIGIQLIQRRYEDEKLLQVAAAVAQVIDTALRR